MIVTHAHVEVYNERYVIQVMEQKPNTAIITKVTWSVLDTLE